MHPGARAAEDAVAMVRTADGIEMPVSLLHRWPVRRARPVLERLAPVSHDHPGAFEDPNGRGLVPTFARCAPHGHDREQGSDP